MQSATNVASVEITKRKFFFRHSLSINFNGQGCTWPTTKQQSAAMPKKIREKNTGKVSSLTFLCPALIWWIGGHPMYYSRETKAFFHSRQRTFYPSPQMERIYLLRRRLSLLLPRLLPSGLPAYFWGAQILFELDRNMDKTWLEMYFSCRIYVSIK